MPESLNEEKIVHKGEGHRKRLREKFISSGLNGFHDYEVIELLLTLATPRKDCKDAAKEALKKFKTLQGVIEASPQELCGINGIGQTNVFGIKLVKAVCDRYLEKKILAKDSITNSQDLYDYLYHAMGEKDRESFKVIFLDAKNKVIFQETMFVGSLTSTSVYPREVIREALRHNAAALIFAHNHPSGDPSPSNEDIAITKRLFLACKIMGITVHEHIIIGKDKYFSFADNGYIEKINKDCGSW
ncbi:MAG: DNA repair protein RadC [Desulfobacterales bacterium]|nr:DNA repair protein RadC [Desulfobacterales bacterium]